jgi:hypothetical protein
MTEEIEFILDSTKESMIGSIAHLEKEFLNIRAGKASPAMLGITTVQQHRFRKCQKSAFQMQERSPCSLLKKTCCTPSKKQL